MMNVWRDICIVLDAIVYGGVQIIFQIIMDLANLEIFTQNTIATFAKRIYIILGLVMLFKIMISFIQILINPDKMNDKEQGMGNILKRVVISLLLIVFVPSIFKYGRQLQSYIIPVIPKVILGVKADLGVEISMEEVGETMAFYSFLPFFNYNSGCDDGSIAGTGTQLLTENPSNLKVYTVATAVPHVNDSCEFSGDGYRYNYRWLMSTAVGIYLLFILIQVAIKIAIRAIKLGICEFVAPIPIASYIDPKTSKQAFDNWVNTSIKTYLDLFTRLIVVYFVIFVLDTVFKGENLAILYANLDGDPVRITFVTLFIILGLLQFAKQAPKFVSDMLGIKDGGGDIAGMFKGAWTSARETGGYLSNIVKTPISNWKELSNTQYADGSSPSTGRKFGSAVAGVLGVTGHTIRNKISGKSGKELTQTAFSTTTSNRDKRIATKNRRINGYTYLDEKAENWRRRMNISSKDDWAETSYSEYSALADIASEAGSLGLKKGEEQDYRIQTSLKDGASYGALGAVLGNQDSISYSSLQKIANMKEGDLWDGHTLTSSAIADAADRVKKQQKSNKIDFFAQLIRDQDSGAIAIRNKYVDHLKSSPVYNDPGKINDFANAIFGANNSIVLESVDSNGNITNKTFNRTEFNREKLVEMAEHCLSNGVVLTALKNVGEASRNEAQITAAEAQRRNKLRDEAAKK